MINQIYKFHNTSNIDTNNEHAIEEHENCMEANEDAALKSYVVRQMPFDESPDARCRPQYALDEWSQQTNGTILLFQQIHAIRQKLWLKPLLITVP